jgi:glycosyltransferase involved in cell wall biosynthesis
MNWIALLGKKDEPTDGVGDYCEYLAAALARKGQVLELVRMPWEERGWRPSLRWLAAEGEAWRGRWVLLQYTALSWSRRGFSLGAYAALQTLRKHGARCAVVFHDSTSFRGRRLADATRRMCQGWVMDSAYALAERSIFTVPTEQIPWLRKGREKALFIPIGANLPASNGYLPKEPSHEGNTKVVAVYGVTGSGDGPREIADIAYAMRRAWKQAGALRLVVLGRGSAETGDAFRKSLDGCGVEVSVLGVLPAEGVGRALAEADAFLSVRGLVSPRRSSVLAGVVCGLPVVGYGELNSCYPLSEAGLALAPWLDREALADALARVLSDEHYRRELGQRSRRAQATHFDWDQIAEKFLRALGNG